MARNEIRRLTTEEYQTAIRALRAIMAAEGPLTIAYVREDESWTGRQ